MLENWSDEYCYFISVDLHKLTSGFWNKRNKESILTDECKKDFKEKLKKKKKKN